MRSSVSAVIAFLKVHGIGASAEVGTSCKECKWHNDKELRVKK